MEYHWLMERNAQPPNMDEFHRHDVEWKKADPQKYILCDSIYMIFKNRYI